jgi:hypothetical protein
VTFFVQPVDKICHLFPKGRPGQTYNHSDLLYFIKMGLDGAIIAELQKVI